MVKGVIFDLDGTLLDSMWVWREVDITFLKNHSLPVEEDYLQALKSMNFTQCANYTRERYSLNLTDEEMMSEWDYLAKKAYTEQVELKHGVSRYLQFLKENGIKCAIASSCYLSLCSPTLERHGIKEYFGATVTRDDKPKSKEHPDIFFKAADKLGLQAKECVVFEDILSAVITAKKAGFFTVGVSDPASLAERSQIMKLADMYISDFTDPRIYGLFEV